MSNEMTDREIMLAIFDKVVEIDKRVDNLETRFDSLETRFDSLEKEQIKTNIVIENEIKPNIQLLTETIVPVAKRYETEANKIESMESDINLLKRVVAEHSEKLNKLA